MLEKLLFFIIFTTIHNIRFPFLFASYEINLLEEPFRVMALSAWQKKFAECDERYENSADAEKKTLLDRINNDTLMS